MKKKTFHNKNLFQKIYKSQKIQNSNCTFLLSCLFNSSGFVVEILFLVTLNREFRFFFFLKKKKKKKKKKKNHT